jgi:hypothetical protein
MSDRSAEMGRSGMNLRRGPAPLTASGLRGRLSELPSGFGGFVAAARFASWSPAALTLAGAGVGVPHPGVWAPSPLRPVGAPKRSTTSREANA